MPFVHDQEVVEALRSHGAYEPLGKSIGIRGPKGRFQDLSALGSEDRLFGSQRGGVSARQSAPSAMATAR
jgi:hypothetical protein